MKGIIRTVIVVGFVLLGTLAPLFAEVSDYERVERFKAEYNDIIKAIHTTGDQSEITLIAERIKRLSDEYEDFRAFLNDALYPQKYDDYIGELRRSLSRATQRVALTSEKVQLSNRLTQNRQENIRLSLTASKLAEENRTLKALINKLRLTREKDKETIDKLNTMVAELIEKVAEQEKLVAELKDKIEVRDRAVVGMTGELMNRFDKKITDKGKDKNIQLTVEKNEIFDIILSTIKENSDFVKSGFLQPDDLIFAKEEHDKLSDIWERFKPEFEAMHGKNTESAASMRKIQATLDDWANQIDSSPWKTLHALFTDNGFELANFQNGSEFKNAVVTFVDQEIQQNKRKRYGLFVETLWAEEIAPQWLPYLIDTQRLTPNETAEIEAKFREWAGLRDYLMWGIIGGVVVCMLVIGAVMARRRKS
ncbi:MAG TPA: hypothetical protein PLA74_03335 [Syntrophales bacterium]|nr:hypothetical protein [Syntrophales bacterium]HPQ42633.1 hypothetical protein [Syntrophales bacterium]